MDDAQDGSEDAEVPRTSPDAGEEEPAGAGGAEPGDPVGGTKLEPAGEAELQEGDETAHDHHAHDFETVSAAVLTISSSRTIQEDTAGDAIVEALEDAGHEVATRNLVNDDYDSVQGEVDSLVDRDDVYAVITTGGTGVTPDDVTAEAVRPLFEKELPGFGELFRRLSFDEIGTRVVGTRAVAGIADCVPVFCLPGSEAAARLGTAEVIVPEVGHIAGLACEHGATKEDDRIDHEDPIDDDADTGPKHL